MKSIIVMLSLTSVIILSSCVTRPPNAYIPLQTPETTPSPAPTAVQVSLDYFGIKSTHQPAIYWAPNTIQLYTVVDDGKTSNKYSYPSSNEGIIMSDFQLVDLREQTIFSTASAGDYLRISIVAYSCQDKETALDILKTLETFQPGLSTLREFYQTLPQKKELIGYYEHTWYPIENWGTAIGEYEEENGDLTVWFRIWSTNKPEVIPRPAFGPDVKIRNVILPSNVEKRSPIEIIFVTTYLTTISLQNNEAEAIMVNVSIEGQGQCPDLIAFTGGPVTIPGFGHKDITTKYYYETAGIRQITYTIYYKGNKLDA